jgi:hypothetical protein
MVIHIQEAQIRRCSPVVTLGFRFLFVSLILSVLPTTSSTGQNELQLCTIPPNGRQLMNYGRQWHTWSNASRTVYLEGFVDGLSNTFSSLRNDLPADRREPLRLQIFTFFDSDVLRDVMTNLYSDPANTYIRYDSMVYIARDRLGGKDTEPRLRLARKQDCGFTGP